MATRTFTYHGFPSYILLPLQLFHGWVLPVPSRRTPGSSGLAEWPLAALAALYTSLWFRGVLDEWPLAVLATLYTSLWFRGVLDEWPLEPPARGGSCSWRLLLLEVLVTLVPPLCFRCPPLFTFLLLHQQGARDHLYPHGPRGTLLLGLQIFLPLRLLRGCSLRSGSFLPSAA